MKNLFIFIILTAAALTTRAAAQVPIEEPTAIYSLLNPTASFAQDKVEELFTLLPRLDVLSIYTDSDVLHIIRQPQEEANLYSLECEGCEHIIGLFSLQDAAAITFWALLNPIEQDNSRFNHYYQTIIEEKIWE